MSQSPTLSDNVAANVRAEMAAQRKTSADLADVLGLSHRAALRRWSGTQPIALNELFSISRWLNVPTSSLMAERTQAVAS